jgi:tetratricopeptide (TPR) repeat protein
MKAETTFEVRNMAGQACFRIIFAFTAVIVCLFSSTQSYSQTTQSPSTIFRNAKPSIVFIVAGDEKGNPTVQGSGFVIARDRIVTNHHVVAGTSTAVAVFSDGGSSPITSVVADSAAKDLIILGASTGQRPAVPLGDELALQQGDPVYAIGAPKGLELTLTNGIVSAFRTTDDRFLIQSTAAIGHGSSGGPLFNGEGKVVGITSAMLSDTPGIYFSVGVGDLKRLLRNPQLLVLDFSEWAKQNAGEKANGSGDDAASTGASRATQIDQLIRDKKFDEARTAIEALEASEPDAAVTYRLLGEFNQKTGHPEDALRQLQISVEKDSTDPLSQFYFAISLYYARRFDEALAHEVKSNELSPTASDTPLLAVLYYSVRNYKQAEDMARKALQSDANSEMALSVLAGLAFHRVSVQQENWATDVQRLLIIDPDNFWVHVSQGYEDQRNTKVEAAKAAFKAAENDSFPDSAAYVALARLYQSESDFGRANDEIKAGLSEIPDDSHLLSAGIFISLITRDHTEAARRFQRLERGYPGSSETLTEGCLYYYGVGQATNALPYCARLTEQSPSFRIAHSNYGWAALDANQFQLAATEFSTAYKLAAADWSKLTEIEAVDLLWGSTMALYNSGDKKDAGVSVEFIRKNHPAAATVTGLQQLPLLWSTITMSRIEALLREFPN